jgi:sugar phosphate isomerase/epimerase
MKIAIDSYCYHRFFGEVYPEQSTPDRNMSQEDFLHRARALGVDGVSLESCYIPADLSYIGHLRDILDEANLDRVWAWGHRDGLEGGTNEEALRQLIAHLDFAQAIGAKVMRVVGSSRRFRHLPHEPQLAALARMLAEAVKPAQDRGIRLALENHIDFTAAEIQSLLDRVASPFLGLCFDTGNCVRLLDDPLKMITRLARYCFATHVKDLRLQPHAPVDAWYFFSSVPLGDGFVNLPGILQTLAASNYTGLLAIEIDFLHPSYDGREDAAVEQSVAALRRLVHSIPLTRHSQGAG